MACARPQFLYRLARPLLYLWGLGLLGAAPVRGQTVELRQADTGATRIEALLGQTVAVEAVADLGALEASGFSLFISIAAGPFRVVDASTRDDGINPFVAGALFADASQFVNRLLPLEQTPAPFAGRRLLDYALLLRPGEQRRRGGSGVLARFRLLCVQPATDLQVRIDQSPARPSALQLADGGEALFLPAQPLSVTVRAIHLEGIPDVVVRPGRSDSLQIGRLDRYVQHHRAPLDSLQWTVDGPDLDRLGLSIDPLTRRVALRPQPGWSGRSRLRWTVTEPRPPAPGLSPASAVDLADVVVNTPPRFILPADTLRLVEDQQPFDPTDPAPPPPAAAFRWQDLDLLVEDTDGGDLQTSFIYAVLYPRTALRLRVDPTSHELLVWTRPDFAGVDSLQILVANPFAPQDTDAGGLLRLRVEVENRPEAPRFIFPDSVLLIPSGQNLRLPIAQLVADDDTPLTELQLSWRPDPSGRFSVRRQGDALIFSGSVDFVGQGFFVFEVRDPDGLSASRLLRLNAQPRLRPPPDPPGERPAPFALAPLPVLLEVRQGQIVEPIDLDDLVLADSARLQLSWSVQTLDDSLNALASVRPLTHLLRLRGLAAGSDSLVVTAYAADGTTRSVGTRIAVLPPLPTLRLAAVPDQEFVAGRTVIALADLTDLLPEGSATHLRWSTQILDTDAVTAVIRSDRALLLSAATAAQARLVVTAEDTLSPALGRDTATVTVLDTTQGRLRLKPLPRLRLEAGQRHDDIRLDDFLPDRRAYDTLWTALAPPNLKVTVGPAPPHLLQLEAGPLAQTDTLHLSADLGRGFVARGALVVEVQPPPELTRLHLQIVPHPLGNGLIDVFVLADGPLAERPSLTRAPAPAAPTVTLHQSETDLAGRGFLIWSGNIRLGNDFAGVVTLAATARTPQGRVLTATKTLSVAAVPAAAAARLAHDGVEIRLPEVAAHAVALSLVVEQAPLDHLPDGLEFLRGVHIHPPTDLPQSGALRWPAADARAGLYRQSPDGWVYLSGFADGTAPLKATGSYGILRDTAPPEAALHPSAADGSHGFDILLSDIGSGLDPRTLSLSLNGNAVPLIHRGLYHRLELPTDLAPGSHTLTLHAADRAGNPLTHTHRFTHTPTPLPTHFTLGPNYPNPFNATTQIPLSIPPNAPTWRLALYNIAGQLIQTWPGTRRPGSHTLTWNAHDLNNHPVGSGIYLYRLETPTLVHTRALTLLK